MRSQKTFLFAVIVLTIVSTADASLILTLNGLDAAKEPLEIKGKDNLVIAVAGQIPSDANNYSVTAVGGKLDAIAEANNLGSEAGVGNYLFIFEDELSVGAVSLIANDDMIIDGISVVAGGTIYELVLFYNPETDTVIAFGINLEALSYIPQEPEPEPEPELQPEAQPEPEPPPQPEQEIAKEVVGSEQSYSGFMPSPPTMNYIERKAHEKAMHLFSCPDNIGGLQIPDFNQGNLESLSFPSKASKDLERTFTVLGDGDGGGGIMTMGMDSVIDVNSDITSNTVWTADNTYHVVADVNVQALLVVEPGTVVTFAPDKSMSVNNGGTLISVGTPDNPIIYTSDSGTPAYADYYSPMYIEETASSATKLMYNYVEYAYVGIVVLNNELEVDIQNNYFYNNVYGIVEQGIKHTPIRNNLAVASYYSGIEVFLADVNGQASSDSFILIENNTCDFYQDNGIVVHGVVDANDAGVVVLANNIVSGSYQYGLALVDYYMYATVMNTGYFDNANNKNWEFEEENPVFETVLPYEMGTGPLPVCYLRQDCNFIDTGYQYVEETPLIGKTTDVNDLPDTNYVDIGFHYPNWNFVNAGAGSTLDWDLNGNLIVDFKDFAIFANGWQTTYDMNDLAAFTDEWLQSTSGHPQISVAISGDPCNLSGDIEIGVSGYGYETEQAFVLIDGQFFEEIFGFDDGYVVELETHSFSKGQHTIKIVTVDPNNIITVSPPTIVNFNNDLHYTSMSDNYEPGKDYRITAMYSGNDNLRVDVVDIEDNVVWSNTFSGDLNITIPAATFDSNGLYEVSVNETGMLLEDYKSWKKKVSKKFKPGDVNPNTKGLIICPDKKVTKGKYECIQKAIKAFEQKGIEYIVLYRKNAKYENMAFCLTELPIKHLYFIGHSHYKIGDKLRTVIELSDGIAASVKASDFDPNNVPDWCESIGKWEKKAKSIFGIGIPLGKLKIVFFDGCYTGRLKFTGGWDLVEGPGDDPGQMNPWPNDMSEALGISYSDQVYKGWYGKSFAFNFLTYYITWSNNFWDRLRLNDSIDQAINYCIWNTPGVSLQYGPHKNWRLKGFGDIYSIRLQN